jgi:hypothetical protein
MSRHDYIIDDRASVRVDLNGACAAPAGGSIRLASELSAA